MTYRTIIIEDDASIRDLLKLAAETRGHEVLTFSNPTFCSLASHPGTCIRGKACSDVVISDHMMPEMSRLEFFSILKDHQCLVTSKILVTASREDGLGERAAALGCEVIPKPFRFGEIEDLLAKAESQVPQGRELIPLEELKTEAEAC